MASIVLSTERINLEESALLNEKRPVRNLVTALPLLHLLTRRIISEMEFDCQKARPHKRTGLFSVNSGLALTTIR